MSDVVESGATAAENKKIRDVIKRRAFPPGVRKKDIDIKFGTDSTGLSAMWITFLVDRDYENPTRERLQDIVSFADQVRAALIGHQSRFWPYIEFKTPN